MFGEAAVRLLREQWQNATLLAEELFAMFEADVPLTSKSGGTISQPAGSTLPALTLQIGDGPAIQFRRPDGTVAGTLVLGGDNLNFPALLDGSGKYLTPLFPVNPDTGQPLDQRLRVTGGGSGGGFPGVIQSGSGDTYVVNIYPAGLSGAPRPVTARQLYIAAGQSLSPGTAVTVVQTADGSYYMQAPVWGAPA